MHRMLLLCGLLAVMAGWCGEPAAFDRDAYPAMLKLGELTDEWAMVSIASTGNSAPFSGTLSLSMLSQMPVVYYTKGQTAPLGGRVYLVVYRPESIPPKNEAEMERFGLLTPDTRVLPALAPLDAMTDMAYLGRFNLKAEIQRSERQRVVLPRPPEPRVHVQEGVPRPPARPAGQEGQVRQSLHIMRQALARFKADTGAWPAALADLVKPPEDTPVNGIDDDGNPVAIAAGTYAGPYLLPARGGIREAPGLPPNPYIDLRMKEPDPGLVITHWHYRHGAVSVPEYMFGIRTSDGMMLGEL